MKQQNKNTTTTEILTPAAAVTMAQTHTDFKNSLLIVSIAINAFVLTAWLAIQLTNAYDTQVVSFLFSR